MDRIALKMGVVFLAACFLASCATTPKIKLIKGAGMSMELTKPASYVFSVVFSPNGKYALSGSLDNVVAIWDIETGKEIKTIKAKIGPGVSALSISRDGRYLLTGTKGGGGVILWDADTWKEIRSLPGHSFTEAMEAFAFSPDSKYAISGGSYQIKQWDVETGKELGTITHASFFDRNQSYAIAFSPDGSLAFVKGIGFISLWNIQTGERLWIYGANTGGERWGHMIRFNSSAKFSPDGEYILSGEGEVLKLRDVTSGRVIRTFVDEATGQIDSVAFSPDGKYALSGSVDGNIRLWDVGTGVKLKKIVGHSDEIASVTFSPDGRRVLSGGDASTRLWDISTGEEVAMMVGFEDGEWIVITPNGYYNSSPNGDKYLSVKVGGKDYTIEQLRESFYRPDLVKLALAGGSLKEFKKVADIKQPPIVSIVDTPKGVDMGEARVTLKIEDQGGGIGDIRLYLNGSAVVLDSTRGVSIVPTRQDNIVYKTYTIKLTNGLNTIKAMAFNADNTMNSTEVLHEITASFKTLAKPSLYAIAVGINEYRNPRLQLNYAVADAGLFADTLQKGAAGLFDKIIIKRLTSPQETTNNNITEELKAMQKQLKPDDLFVFYVASHGTVDDGEYFLITSNVGSTSTAKLKTDAIPQHALKELIANIPATKKLIVIDTCSAGALGDAIQTAMLTRGMSEDTAMKVLSRAVGSTILMASTAVQEALEGYNGHGVFTYIVSEGLNGKADSDKDGFIKTTELANYVDDEVPALAEKVFKKAQYPTVSPSGQAFPVGRVK